MDFIENALSEVPFPRIVKVRQHFNHPVDAADVVRGGVAHLSGYLSIKPGQRIAITGSSRGTDRMVEVLRTLVEMVKERGAHPFIIPAMGSHGGATAEGQRNMLMELGITEENVGAPIYASMDVVLIDHISDVLCLSTSMRMKLMESLLSIVSKITQAFVRTMKVA